MSIFEGKFTFCYPLTTIDKMKMQVSSQEAPLKGEQADTIYDNSSAVTRPHRGVNIPSGQQYFAAPTPLGLDGYPYHRQNPVSSFGYPIKPYPFQHPYGEVTDEHIDYSSSPYQLMGSEQLGISPYACGSSSSSRNWSHAISVTPLPKDNTIYLEQDGLLNHPQYNPGTFPFRSASSPESKSLSLNSIATALPTTSADPDRVLPYPATGRQIHGPPLLRSSESHGSLHSHSQANRSMDGLPSYNCLMNTGMMGGSVKSLSDTTVAENASLAASYHTLPSTSESSQQTSDSYSTQERLYPVTNNSTEDLRYVTSQTTTNRRQSGPYSEINGTLSSPSTSVLSSGHEYVPLSRRAYYPTPPMAVPQMEIQSQSQSHQSHNQSVPTIPAA